jgi:hypothetical protein
MHGVYTAYIQLVQYQKPTKKGNTGGATGRAKPESGLAQEPDGEVRHHPGIPGGIIPLYPGVFVGIRNVEHV